MSNPLVSIVVATYNRLESLKKTLESIASQTYLNIEIIIVDDNSNDGTKEFLFDYALSNLRSVVYINDTNKGLAFNRNIGIFNGKGKYFTFIDDDDCLTENAIRDYVNFSEKLEEKSFIVLGGSKKNILGVKVHYLFDFNGNLRDAFRLGITPPVGAQFYPRRMLLLVNGYNPLVLSGVDHDLWIRLIKLNPLMLSLNSSTTVQNCHQNHPSRMTRQFNRRLQYVNDAILIWHDELNIISKSYFDHFRHSYYYYLTKQKLSKTKFIFYIMFKFKPNSKVVFIYHYIAGLYNSIYRKFYIIRFVMQKRRTDVIIHINLFSFPQFKSSKDK